eukprot:4639743-Alexandrium_andersonii.AAC.1
MLQRPKGTSRGGGALEPMGLLRDEVRARPPGAAAPARSPPSRTSGRRSGAALPREPSAHKQV